MMKTIDLFKTVNRIRHRSGMDRVDSIQKHLEEMLKLFMIQETYPSISGVNLSPTVIAYRKIPVTARMKFDDIMQHVYEIQGKTPWAFKGLAPEIVAINKMEKSQQPAFVRVPETGNIITCDGIHPVFSRLIKNCIEKKEQQK